MYERREDTFKFPFSFDFQLCVFCFCIQNLENTTLPNLRAKNQLDLLSHASFILYHSRILCYHAHGDDNVPVAFKT